MKKSYTYILLLGAMSLHSAVCGAQGVLSPKTAIIASECCGANGVMGAPAKSKLVSAYVTIDTETTSWNRLGIRPLTVAGNTATVRLSANDITRLAKMEGVKYVQLSSGVSQMLDVARSVTGTDDIHKGTSLPQPYTGKDVVVGIVDAGFDYMHSAFRNPLDGSLRIKRVWEQRTSTLDGAKAPEQFGYGIELNTEQLITSSQGDVEGNSHGTHVAGIAAGSDDYKDGAYVGNAPDADIVLVALDLSDNTNANISDAVKYVFDYADEVGKPCVVNLSLGSHDGPHDGTSTFDVMTDQMQRPGRLIVGAAGNHRTDKFHIDHTFLSADDNPLRTFVDYKLGLSTTNVGGNIEIWGEKDSEFTVELSAYNTFNKADAVSTTIYPANDVEDVSFSRYATGSWKVASEISPLNGKPHIVLTSGLTGIRTNYAIALTIKPKNAGRVNIWADNSYLGLKSMDIDGFSEPDATSSTLAEIGGTGKRILTVGAYTTRNDYTTNTSSGTTSETLGDICSFSSYGPTADGRIKPDISAPGSLIISALSSNDSSDGLMYAEWYDKYDHTNIYGYMQGTSMSSPFVAGIVATWLQAYPELSPEQLHDIVEATAIKDEFCSAAPDSNWGYGKINAMDGLKKCIDMKTAGCENIDMPFDGYLSIAEGCMNIAFMRQTKAVVNVANMQGYSVFYKDLGMQQAGQTTSVALPQLDKGVYVVSLQMPGSTKTYKYINK